MIPSQTGGRRLLQVVAFARRSGHSACVRVVCSNCGSDLTIGLRALSADVLDRAMVDAPSLPDGAIVIDPGAVTVHQSGPGSSPLEIEQAPPNAVVVRPDAIIEGTVTVIGIAAGCCGLDGQDGPNQACASRGQVLGTAWTDCWTVHEVRFNPGAVLLVE